MDSINYFYSTLRTRSNGMIQLLGDLNIKIDDTNITNYTGILQNEIEKLFAPDSATLHRLQTVIADNAILINLLKLYKNLIEDGYGEKEASPQLHLKLLILAKDMQIFTYKTALIEYKSIKKLELDGGKN